MMEYKQTKKKNINHLAKLAVPFTCKKLHQRWMETRSPEDRLAYVIDGNKREQVKKRERSGMEKDRTGLTERSKRNKKATTQHRELQKRHDGDRKHNL